jgi:hypothetical protein
MTSCCPEEKENHPSPCDCRESPAEGLKPDFLMLGNEAGACCGSHAPAPCSPHEKPGYRLWRFVEDFMETPAGSVPRVGTRLNREDRIGTLSARLGIGRDSYRIAPGL